MIRGWLNPRMRNRPYRWLTVSYIRMNSPGCSRVWQTGWKMPGDVVRRGREASSLHHTLQPCWQPCSFMPLLFFPIYSFLYQKCSFFSCPGSYKMQLLWRNTPWPSPMNVFVQPCLSAATHSYSITCTTPHTAVRAPFTSHLMSVSHERSCFHRTWNIAGASQIHIGINWWHNTFKIHIMTT